MSLQLEHYTTVCMGLHSAVSADACKMLFPGVHATQGFHTSGLVFPYIRELVASHIDTVSLTSQLQIYCRAQPTVSVPVCSCITLRDNLQPQDVPHSCAISVGPVSRSQESRLTRTCL